MSHATQELDDMMRSQFPNGTRVRWTEIREGSWAGNGEGIVVAYEGERPLFDGYAATKTQPPRGPALCIILDGPRKYDIWVAPGDVEKLNLVAA
jgi:hypothetical protein